MDGVNTISERINREVATWPNVGKRVVGNLWTLRGKAELKTITKGPDLTPEMVELFIEQRSATVGRLLPSAADLDAVAEEQRIKEKTSGQDQNL